MSPLVGHREKYCLLASTWIPFGVLKTGGKNWVFSPQYWITWSWWLNPSVFLTRISIPKISKFGFNLFYFGIVCQPYLEKEQFKIKTDLTTASWWSLRICVPARSLISRIPRGLKQLWIVLDNQLQLHANHWFEDSAFIVSYHLTIAPNLQRMSDESFTALPQWQVWYDWMALVFRAPRAREDI